MPKFDTPSRMNRFNAYGSSLPTGSEGVASSKCFNARNHYIHNSSIRNPVLLHIGGATPSFTLWTGNCRNFRHLPTSPRPTDIYCMVRDPLLSTIYIGGHNYTYANRRIVKWNGLKFEVLGDGLPGLVPSIAHDGTYLYASYLSSSVTYNLSIWDGSNWYDIAEGIPSTTGVFYLYYDSIDDVVYVSMAGWYFYSPSMSGTVTGGVYDAINDITTVTSSSGVFISNHVGHSIKPDSKTPRVIKTYNSASSVVVTGDASTWSAEDFKIQYNIMKIAYWDGSSFSQLLGGLNGTALSMCRMGEDIYMGGNFTQAYGLGAIPAVNANRIIRWDGTGWHALGTGVNGIVRTITHDGTNIYVGGYFTQAGGNPASRIAKWDGSNWTALGDGMNDNVNALAYDGKYLYAGGAFTSAGGLSVKNTAMWDGESWSKLSDMDSSSYSSTVHSLLLGVAATNRVNVGWAS